MKFDSLLNPPISKKLILVGTIILILTILSVSSYFAFQKYFVHKTPSVQSTDTEYSKILDQLAKLTDLPAGEEPTIATVSDKEKLQEQAFFSQSENGDKVIIYQNAKKAYLYRPSTNKIIGIAPININSDVTASGSAAVSKQIATSSPTPIPQKITVAILNATQIKGLAKSAQERIEKEIPQIEVISTGNSKSDYPKTLVVNITGQNSSTPIESGSTLESLVKLSQGELTSTFPSGETKPNVDVLLILGPDYKN